MVQETGIKAIPMEKKRQKATWLPGKAFHIAVRRREAKSKGEKTLTAFLRPPKVPRHAGFPRGDTFFPLILLGGLHIVLINQHIHWVAAVCLALSWATPRAASSERAGKSLE